MEENKNEQKKIPIYKKWWFWVLIVLGIILIGSAGGGAASSGDKNDNTITAKFNETVTLNKLDFTVTDVYNTQVLSSIFDDGRTENNFVVITIVVKNNSTSKKTIFDDDFSYRVGNNKYEPDTASIYLDDGFWLNETIAAGLTSTFSLVFEVPSEYETTDYLLIKYASPRAKIYME